MNGKKQRENCFVKCRTSDLFSVKLQLRQSLLIYTIFPESRIIIKYPTSPRSLMVLEWKKMGTEVFRCYILASGQHYFSATNAVGSGVAHALLSANRNCVSNRAGLFCNSLLSELVNCSQCLSLSYFSGTGPDQYCILSDLSKPSREGNHSGAELCSFWNRSIPWQC